MSIKTKIFLVLNAVFILTSLMGCSRNNKVQEPLESGKDISIFVATDIHYLAKELNDNGEAFQSYFSSGDGKQLNYVDEIVNAFINDIEKKEPNILIISGDLTNNGEKESHLKLAEKLKRMEKTTGTRVFVIPGNHDIENPWARGFQGKDQYVVDSINSNEFERIYKDLGYQDAISRDTSTLSYLAAPSKDVWLLMLDTNVYKTNYKYGSPATYGKINEDTYKWIKECSKLAKENHARVITVMHHNLINHSLVLSSGFTLDHSEEAVEIFKECGLNLVLSGHIHMQDIKSNKAETNPIYDIATSSLSVYPVQYGIIKYLPTQGFSYNTAKVDVEGWAKEKGISDENVTNFQTYNKDFFSQVSYKMAYDALTETGTYSEEEKISMVNTISLMNLHYFAGTMSSIRDQLMKTKGYKLWRTAEEPESLTRYVRSMVYDFKIDNTHLEIMNEDLK